MLIQNNTQHEQARFRKGSSMRRCSLMVTSLLLLVVLCTTVFAGTVSAQTTHHVSTVQSTHAYLSACSWTQEGSAGIYDLDNHYLGYVLLWYYPCNGDVYAQTVSSIGVATVESTIATPNGYSDLQCRNCTEKNSDTAKYARGQTVAFGAINGWGAEVGF